MKLTKNDLMIFGVIAIFFGAILILTNPIDFTGFPQHLAFGSAVGIIIFLGGLAGFWYGAR